MKHNLLIRFLVLAGLLSFIVGCATTQELSSSISSKVSSITSTVDPALVNQVPADKREGFAKAEFDLNLATQNEKLAEMKTELAGLQKKKAGYEEDLAGNFKKEADNAYDSVKIEAIIKAGIGKNEDNNKTKANVDSKKYKILADRAKIKSDIEEMKGKVENKTAEIAKRDEAIKAMTFDGGKSADKQTVTPAVPEQRKEETK
jgi:multidrug resistance efflux pump